MRWLLRLVLLWALLAPLGYFLGLPYLLDYINKRTKADTYTQCLTQMGNAEGITVLEAEAKTETAQYCRCLSDGLIFTRDDLFDVLQKKQPVALTKLTTAMVTACSNQP